MTMKKITAMALTAALSVSAIGVAVAANQGDTIDSEVTINPGDRIVLIDSNAVSDDFADVNLSADAAVVARATSVATFGDMHVSDSSGTMLGFRVKGVASQFEEVGAPVGETALTLPLGSMRIIGSRSIDEDLDGTMDIHATHGPKFVYSDDVTLLDEVGSKDIITAAAGYGMGRYLVNEPVSGGGYKLYVPHSTTLLRDGSSTTFKTTVSFSIVAF